MTDINKLLRFAGAALTETRVKEIGDWDGGDLQDVMVDCGLLDEVTMAAPCGEECRCREFYSEKDFPITCFRISDLGQRAIEVFRQVQDKAND